MAYEQEYLVIQKEGLVAEVTHRKLNGWRLAQISATFKDGYDIIYSLEREYDMVNLRVSVGDGEAVDSVSAIYPYAFLYENEMRDLFGVEILGMNVDFHGKLYQTAVRTPFRAATTESVVGSNE